MRQPEVSGYCTLAVLLVFSAALTAPLIWFPYVPTQDGPSHLYVTTVLARFAGTPIYQEFLELRIPLAGNFASELIMLALQQVFSPVAAEKILHGLYAIGLPLSFYSAARALCPGSEKLSLLILPYVFNHNFHMGFWNFNLSMPVLIWLTGWSARMRGRWGRRSLAGLGLVSLLLYCMHPVSWVLGGIAVLVLSASKQDWGWLLAVMLPASAPLFVYLSANAPAGLLAQLAESAGRLPAFTPIHGFSRWEHMLGRVYLVFIAILFLVVVVPMAVSRRRWGQDRVLGLACIYGLVMALAPLRIGQGSEIKWRVLLAAHIVLLLWLAAQYWQSRGVALLAGVGACVAVAMMAARIPDYAKWNHRYQECVELAGEIPPGSKLGEIKSNPLREISPLYHVSGLFLSSPLIRLRTYEFDSDHFLMKFRQDARITPDYLLWVEPPLEASRELPGYKLIRASRPEGLALLYQRSP